MSARPAIALAAVALALATLFAAGSAHAETRTLKLYYIHTKERAEITYKKDGRYVQSGLNQLNRFLRDWRRNEPTKMDPRLFDLVWEAYQRVGGRDYIHVVSAYRSPATNSMLRSRSNGVAKNSQHTLGRAMDFYIPGVKLAKLREAGLKMGGGGVGYYPTSGAPFVHLDVGSVRHWPRMSRKELVSVFPNGGTLHVPSDGKPLPNYEQALAAYKSKGRTGPTINVASGGSGEGRGRGLLATLFGGGADEEEESGSEFQRLASVSPRDAGAAPTARRSEPAAAVRRTEPGAPEPSAPLPGVAAAGSAVEIPQTAPIPAAEPEPVQDDSPAAVIAALSARSVPVPAFAPRAAPPAAAAAVAAVAKPAEGVTVASLVPVPTLRPQAAADVPPAAAEPAVQTAAATPEAGVAAVPTPAQPAVMVGQSDIQLAAFAPVPELRPATGPIAELIAAMPPVQQPLDAERDLAAVETGASQRSAILAAAGKVVPEKAIATNVRTTAKAARPGPQDGKADPRPVVIPVDDIAAQWALEKAGRLQRAIASAKEPSLAHKAIRTAPTQVYTSGFAPVAKEPDPSRFSGNAVTFLSVARFDATN
ncbi:DUF882 domain-containing protein [Aquibium microcysteis]|uniref:DUF882 domain-containing protein n=1 Tax=Aquibium microcysteis TaxID=675281 RepID=UPI00165CF2AC|nr:DUF882 domain-containing protein [Aquibium microcysteis]